MRGLIIFFGLIAFSTAQYIDVGEPNPSAPGPVCSNEVFTCPDAQPEPVPPPPTIPSLFSPIFQFFENQAKCDVEEIYKIRGECYAEFINALQCFNIIDDPCDLLNDGLRLVNKFLNLVVGLPNSNNIEFTRVFDQALSQLVRILGDVAHDPTVQCAMHTLQQLGEKVKADLVNNALYFHQLKSATYQQYTNDIQKLHQTAVNSACPKESQTQFQSRFGVLYNDLTQELVSYLNTAQQIGILFQQRVRELAWTIAKAKIAATTLILT